MRYSCKFESLSDVSLIDPQYVYLQMKFVSKVMEEAGLPDFVEHMVTSFKYGRLQPGGVSAASLYTTVYNYSRDSTKAFR